MAKKKSVKKVNKLFPVEKKKLPPWMNRHPSDNKQKKLNNVRP